MVTRPLIIQQIKTASGATYLYDAVSNHVFPYSEVFYEVLKLNAMNSDEEQIGLILDGKYGKEIVARTQAKIQDLIHLDHCFFTKNGNNPHPTKYEISEKEYWDILVNQLGCNQLILSVTENCNLRCKYCVYSSGFYPQQRMRTSRSMTFDTAKAAIDYFCTLRTKVTRPLPRPFITFYGGEPLMNFDLIKQCIEYAEQKETENLQFGFNLTTNATLMTGTMIDYFIRKRVMLSISLDGPEQTHDANRVTAAGQGSFTKVMESIRRIREIDREYFETNVMTLTTYDWMTDLEEVNQFFLDKKLDLPIMSMVNMVSEAGDYYGQFSSSVEEKFYKQIRNLLRKYFEEKCEPQEKPLNFLDVLFQIYSITANRDHIRDPFRTGWYTGACIPGMKIAVNPDGSFHICERVNDHYPIGDCWKGLNPKIICSMMEQYGNHYFEKCHSCIAQRLCQVCWARACGEGGDNYRTEEICKKVKVRAVQALEIVYSVLERNPRAFKEIPKAFKDYLYLWT